MKNSNPVFNHTIFTKPQGVSGNEIMTVSITKRRLASTVLNLKAMLSSVTWLFCGLYGIIYLYDTLPPYQKHKYLLQL